MTEEELRTIAKKRVEARMGFAIHAAIYVVANLGFVAIWAATGAGYPWFVWPMLGWGIGIVSHGLSLVYGPESARGLRAIDRELRRLQSQH